MVSSIFRYVFFGITYLSIFVAFLVTITDPEIFRRNFYGEEPFNFIDFVSDIWPKQILICFLVLLVFFALTSEKTLRVLRLFEINGNIVLSFISAVYALAIVALIYGSGVTYPLTLDHESIVTIGLLMGGSIVPLPIILISVNHSVSNPAHISFIVIPCILVYLGICVWLNFVLTGEISIVNALKRICC